MLQLEMGSCPSPPSCWGGPEMECFYMGELCVLGDFSVK